jgi:hypothetical protein
MNGPLATANPLSELDVADHDGNPVRMDGAALYVVHQADDQCLGSPLQGLKGVRCPVEPVPLDVLYNFLDETGEGKLPDQQIRHRIAPL